MSNVIKPIETKYDGYLFRSRLEARWAVFFKAAGIKYQYEPQGFTDDKAKYLPDFYLPDWDTYAEVKGDEERYHADLDKICKILEGKESPIRRLLILGDIPYDEESNGIFWFPILYYHPLKDAVVREYRTFFWRDEDEDVSFVFDWSLIPDCAEQKYRWQTVWKNTYDKQTLTPIPDTVFEPNGVKRNPEEEPWDPFRLEFPSPKLAAAFSAARAERF